MTQNPLLNAPLLADRCPTQAPADVQQIPDELRLFQDKRLSVFYAPFDHINRKARVVLLGITPGWQQTQIAYNVYSDALAAGHDRAKAMALVKQEAAFAGSMRSNLIAMLDELELNTMLDVHSTAELFNQAADAVHTTSLLRYPVFAGSRNYTGHSPLPTKHPFLRQVMQDVLLPELAAIREALIIPLGRSTSSTLELLCSEGSLDTARCLFGFPHPSGANGHRKSEFLKHRAELRRRVHGWFGR